MKFTQKITLLLIITVFSFSSSYSQDFYNKVGIEGGLVQDQLKFGLEDPWDQEENEFKGPTYFGVTYNLGFKFPAGDNYFIVSAYPNFSYFIPDNDALDNFMGGNLPIMAEYEMGDEDAMSITGGVGFDFSFYTESDYDSRYGPAGSLALNFPIGDNIYTFRAMYKFIPPIVCELRINIWVILLIVF